MDKKNQEWDTETSTLRETDLTRGYVGRLGTDKKFKVRRGEDTVGSVRLERLEGVNVKDHPTGTPVLDLNLYKHRRCRKFRGSYINSLLMCGNGRF